MENFISDLNLAQKNAVIHKNGSALVLAGPGSGKTRVLSYRFAWLLYNEKLSPEEILAVTFTNKAAGEMRERINALLAKKTGLLKNRSPWLGTFHAVCAKILRKESRNLGISPSFLIYDESDSQTAIRLAIKKLNLGGERFSPQSVGNIISSAKNELMGVSEFAPFARGPFQQKALLVFRVYEKILAENSALDFDDIILKTVELFKKHHSVLEKYQNQFRRILVDEYQDTNHAQYILTKLLSGKNNNLFVVGDMAQSIYSFRGADFRHLLNFEKDFPDAKIYHLTQNYRSTRVIVEASKNLIGKNLTHIPLDLKTENGNGEKIRIYQAVDEVDEGRFIAETIKRLAKIGNRKLSEFAILYRTNSQSRPIEEVFIKSGLPYVIVGGIRFYERKEIKDVLSYLKLTQNNSDSVSTDRLEKNSKRKFSIFKKWLSEYDSAGKKTIEVLDEVLKATNYLSELDDGTSEGLGRIENVKELRSVASEFPDIVDFLENVTLIQNSTLPSGVDLKSKEEIERVTLMTVHAAKGLEFPSVFIVGLEEGIFPHNRSLFERESLEEERRLCYVGATRAKKELFLTFAERRLYFGSRTNNDPSRFIGEIPPKLTTFETSRGGLKGLSGDNDLNF